MIALNMVCAFYRKEPGYRALQCSKRMSQHQYSSGTSHQNKDLR